MGHFYDYDDTCGRGSSSYQLPVLAAILSLGEKKHKTGKDIILAYVLGFEAGVRRPNSPSHRWRLAFDGHSQHYRCGVASHLCLSSTGKTTFALGLSATQAAGMQQNRGTMSKSFHAGRAASNGILAVLMASSGYDSSDEIVEGRRGFSKNMAKLKTTTF